MVGILCQCQFCHAFVHPYIYTDIYFFSSSVFLCRDFTQDIEYDTNSTLATFIKFLSLGAGGKH